MSQTELVVTLLSLLVLGLGAIALVISMYARTEREEEPAVRSGLDVRDRVELAHRRKEFLRRYPHWAARDFQSDPKSPWNTDPEFSGHRETAGQR